MWTLPQEVMKGNGRNETGDGNQQNDKQPKNTNHQKSSRQSGRGAVRIHKPRVNANPEHPPAPLPVTPT